MICVSWRYKIFALDTAGSKGFANTRNAIRYRKSTAQVNMALDPESGCQTENPPSLSSISSITPLSRHSGTGNLTRGERDFNVYVKGSLVFYIYNIYIYLHILYILSLF